MAFNIFILAEAAPAPGATQPNFLALVVPVIVMMMVVMYLQNRSQKKKAQEHQQLMSKMKSGDRVLTTAGILGTVIAVKEKSVTVRTAGDTKIEFTRGSIVEITTSSDSSEA